MKKNEWIKTLNPLLCCLQLLQLKVSVELQLGEAETLNLTLYGHNNHSSLDLHPPEEQEEETEEGKADKGQWAFYCCLPGVPPAAESTNQTRCLLWLANQTVSTATAEGGLPWKRTGKGWCRESASLFPVWSEQLQPGEETIRDEDTNHSVFISVKLIQSHSKTSPLSVTVESGFFPSIEQISLQSTVWSRDDQSHFPKVSVPLNLLHLQGCIDFGSSLLHRLNPQFIFSRVHNGSWKHIQLSSFCTIPHTFPYTPFPFPLYFVRT